jgi:hypothetical protein
MKETSYLSMFISLAGIAFGIAAILANILGWWPT